MSSERTEQVELPCPLEGHPRTKSTSLCISSSSTNVGSSSENGIKPEGGSLDKHLKW